MKNILYSAVAACAVLAILPSVFADQPALRADWENPAVNSRNRLPARVYTMPLADEQAAFTDALEPATPYRQSLNGIWKISWAGDPALRVQGFEAMDFDDADWLTVDVPSCLETRGFGAPGYVNIRYPHAERSNPKDPQFARILDRDTKKPNYNPVASYRTRFTVPAAWAGREVILRFDGVYSAYNVWVNGQKVGYAEDSKLPSEFNITKFVKAGSNLLAVEVYRWCDGSYLEDQDMFRFTGIFRDVTIWAMPKGGIWDFEVRTTPVGGYDRWKLEVKVEGEGEQRTEVSLYDADRNKVCDLQCSPSPLVFTSTLSARAWSAEKPYLYTLIVRRGADIRARRIGFKEQKIVGHTILVNGKAIKFKGVNRHECSPENGRSVSLEEMRKDITLFKKYNINTVRTCHYPDHHSWYDLCDRYGIYVVAEANVEAHEPGYDEKGLGRFPEWEHTIVERNLRNVTFYRNHPSVTLWSMGNETGHGDCFRHAIRQVKALDPTRPVHWERGNVDADVDSRMYQTVEWLENRGKLGDGISGAKAIKDEPTRPDTHQSANKPFFMCEYAHAMGNAIGNFQEYWDVFYKYESLSGGCIWDWVDQALWKPTGRVDPKTGAAESIFAYGGDYDEEPNDGPFCCNGVVDPLRRVSAKLIEVAHVHRNLVVRRRPDGSFELENRFGFTYADEFDGAWRLVADGETVREGAFSVPHLAPLSLGSLALPAVEPVAGKECFLEVEFRQKAATAWAPKGWVVARDQLPLAGAWTFAQSVEPAKGVRIAEDERTVTVTAGPTKAVFCRRSGTLAELVMNGRIVLKDPAPGIVAGPRLTCGRAVTDNDRWMYDARGSFVSKGLTMLSYHARPLKVAEDGTVTSVVEVTGAKSAGFTHESVYTFGADGSVAIRSTATPRGDFPLAIPRLGLSLELDGDLERMAYYGRGPYENYIDRKTASFLGLWRSTVTDQFEPYVRPQDNGYKCDVRWVTFTDGEGRGVRIVGSEPLFVQALHYGLEDLHFARHRAGAKRHATPLVPRREVMLNLDVRQTGLGGASCGPEPMAKYIYRPIAPVSWTVVLSPVSR